MNRRTRVYVSVGLGEVVALLFVLAFAIVGFLGFVLALIGAFRG